MNQIAAASEISSAALKVVGKLPDTPLKASLLRQYANSATELGAIESCFETLVASRHTPEHLSVFFRNWNMTNDSAKTVAGLGNRISLLLLQNPSAHRQQYLSSSLARLHRIIDEDLAVGGGIIHSDLYYRMATFVCGSDDWLSHRHVLTQAAEFQQWKNFNSLNADDLVIGLLTTVAHEIYTHGEVEFILPLFQQWLEQDFNLDREQARHYLCWISVHCGATEKDHFHHALAALENYLVATDQEITAYDFDAIIAEYLTKKAAVMRPLSCLLEGDTIHPVSESLHA